MVVMEKRPGLEAGTEMERESGGEKGAHRGAAGCCLGTQFALHLFCVWNVSILFKTYKEGTVSIIYPSSFNKYQLAWFTLNGDVCVICPTLKLAQQIAANAITPDLFVYDFKGPGYDDLYSAAHGSELLFLFETLRWVEPDFFKIPW